MPGERRLRIVSRVMAWVCLVLTVLAPLAVVATWLVIEHRPVPPVMAGLLNELTWADRLGGMALGLVPVGIAAIGFLALHALFRRFARAISLDTTNARLLQRFAVSVLAAVPANIVAGALTTVWLSRDFPSGERILAFSVSSDDVWYLVVAVLLLTVAWVLRDAAELAEDHRQIV